MLRREGHGLCWLRVSKRYQRVTTACVIALLAGGLCKAREWASWTVFTSAENLPHGMQHGNRFNVGNGLH